MWRIFLLFISLAAFSYAQQTVLLTFGSSTSHNSIVKESDGVLSVSNLLDTSGKESDFTIKLADGARTNKTACFDTSATSIQSIFGNIVATSAITSNSAYILQFSDLPVGTYTLSVLGGCLNEDLSIETETKYYIETLNSADIKIKSIAYGSNCTKAPQIEDGGTVVAHTVNNDTQKDNWVLIQYDINLKSEGKPINLYSSGNNNIVAVALTAVPEPSSSALLLITLTALITHRRRK